MVPGFESALASALVVHPDAPGTIFVATLTGVFGSTDGGSSWTQLATVPEGEFYERMVIASSRPDTIYAAGQTFGNDEVVHFIAVSTDRGVTWIRHDVALAESESDFVLLAVHPLAPDTLLAKGVDDDPARRLDRLLLSTDGGQTFTSPLSVEKELAAAAFSDDGAVVVAAGIAGLWRSTDAGSSFQQVPGPERISFVRYRDGSLLAGGYYAGFAAGKDGLVTSSDHGDTFQPLLAFTAVTEPVACDASSPTAVACEIAWLDWLAEFGPTVSLSQDASIPRQTLDAGSSEDAAIVADSSTESERGPGSGGCSTASGNASNHAVLLFGLLLLWLRARSSTARCSNPNAPSHALDECGS